jgi:hypothetical protein
MYQLLIAVLVMVVGALFISTGLASANQRFLPSGIDGVSASKAKSQVLDYAALNDDYADLLSKQTGASSFNRADYRQRGYSKAKNNTFNTSLTSGGAIAPSTGAIGTKTLVLVNIRTGKKVEVMVRCGNIRAKKAGPCHCKPVSVRKVNKILINKNFTKTVTRNCPSGQSITITVNGRVRGWVRGSITGKVIGSAKLYLNQQVNLQVTAQISIKCSDVPAQLGPSASNDCKQNEAKNSQGICIAIAVQCKAGEVKDSAGNCVTQTNTAEQNCKAIGGTFNGATQLCTIIQINANCSNVTVVNGSGNVVSTSQEGNCNSSPPPPSNPKCPDGRPVPKDGCDRAPVVNIMGSPAHLYVSGNAYVWIEASDPDGDAVSVKVSAAGSGTVAGLVPVTIRWDGTPCPSGKKCFRATAWAGSTPGTMTITATVTAGGKSDSDSATFPIKPDDFG